MRPLTATLLVTVVGVAGVVGVPVTAAGAGSAQPSAQELWKAYPLQQETGTTGAAPSTPAGHSGRAGVAAAPAATRRPASGTAGSGSSGGWGTALALLAATLAALAAVAAVASRGRLRVAMRRALPRAPMSAPRMLATGLRRAATGSPPPDAPESFESEPAIADSPPPNAPEPFERDPAIADSPPPNAPEPFERDPAIADSPPPGVPEPSPGVPEPFEGEREPRPPRVVAARGRARDSRDGPGGEAAVPLPPDPSQRWIAEIAWTGAERPARFSLVAHGGEHEGAVVLAQSPPLPWPPDGAEEVAALTAAADDLTRAALSAGWSRAARGPAWYARRFAWRPAGEPADPEPVLRVAEPQDEAPTPPSHAGPEPPITPEAASRSSSQGAQPDTPTPPRHRFRRRPWPVEAELLWRCELRWRAGWMRSRLEAIAQPPLGGPRRPVAESNPFTWMLHADPDPDDVEIRSAASDLRAMLLADGWSEIEPGRAWYAHRFLWRRDGEPPSHVDLGDGDDRRRFS